MITASSPIPGHPIFSDGDAGDGRAIKYLTITALEDASGGRAHSTLISELATTIVLKGDPLLYMMVSEYISNTPDYYREGIDPP